jgi:hypothetical protein
VGQLKVSRSGKSGKINFLLDKFPILIIIGLGYENDRVLTVLKKDIVQIL